MESTVRKKGHFEKLMGKEMKTVNKIISDKTNRFYGTAVVSSNKGVG